MSKTESTEEYVIPTEPTTEIAKALEQRKKRMRVVNACKTSIHHKFKNSTKILKNQERTNPKYTSEMFEADMTVLINFTQEKLNELKLPNGQFY